MEPKDQGMTVDAHEDRVVAVEDLRTARRWDRVADQRQRTAGQDDWSGQWRW
jgi:hypothetical protein